MAKRNKDTSHKLVDHTVSEDGVVDVVFKPQPRQELFLSSSADIAIYGGAAGGGKTWSLLVEPMRHIENGRFGAVTFRRTIPEVIKEGGMWDEAKGIYPYIGGMENAQKKMFMFASGARVSFSHLQYEKDLVNWRGAQIAFLGFDQLETFTEKQFFYMLSRNRTKCGIKPYLRATCNPEPGWLANFLAWWIDDEGWAIPERSGVIRWMIRSDNNIIHWADSEEEIREKFPDNEPKSVTFILSTVYDNQALLSKDPGYIANLQMLDHVDRMRLLGDGARGGNWKIKPSAGTIFNRDWFEVLDAVPVGGKEVRRWDFAATAETLGRAGRKKKNPDYTASVRMRRIGDIFYILDVTNERLSPAVIDDTVKNKASQDGKACKVRWEEEGGAAAKKATYALVTKLKGYDADGIYSNDDKITRAKGLAAQAKAGNVKLLKAEWNELFLTHMHAQPDLDHDDIFDAGAGAFNDLLDEGEITISVAQPQNYIGGTVRRQE